MDLILFILILCSSSMRTNVQSDTASLKTLAPLPVGVAIGYNMMKNNPAYAHIVSSQFDQVTFEYALKNGAVVERDGTFDYSHADELVKICRNKGLNIYGHTLCWYQNNSRYLQTLKGDSTAIENFLKKYITTTMTRYKNDIYAWDVVNEAIDSLGHLRVTGSQRPDYFYWGKYLKAGYIARAFCYAHKADPQALLFYNDYDLEVDTAKLDAVVNMINQLKAENVPVNGIGTQMHISIYTPDKGIDRAFRKLASTGLLIRISELDIKVNPSNDPDFILTKAMEEKQAKKCLYVLQSFFKYVPAGQRYGITFWNVGDKDSWIVRYLKRNDFPTLFDQDYQPKPMYDVMLDFFRKLQEAKKD